MSAQQSSTVAETQNLSDAQLLAKFQQRCRHLNEALEAERAKTSKLRRYISQLNAKAAPPAEYHQEQPGLQTLVSEQAKLIEQLYAENQQLQAQNQQLQEVTKARTTQNQQLLTANEKLKACIIGLRRQIREYAERQLASKPAPRPVAPAPAPAPIAAPVAPRWMLQRPSPPNNRRAHGCQAQWVACCTNKITSRNSKRRESKKQGRL